MGAGDARRHRRARPRAGPAIAIEPARFEGRFLSPFAQLPITAGAQPNTLTVTSSQRDDVDGWRPPPAPPMTLAFVDERHAVDARCVRTAGGDAVRVRRRRSRGVDHMGIPTRDPQRLASGTRPRCSPNRQARPDRLAGITRQRALMATGGSQGP